MKRTDRTAYGIGMGLAVAVIATVAVASVLALTRFSVYGRTSGSAGTTAVTGTHVLVQHGPAPHDGDVVVYRDARHAGDQIGRLPQDTLADSRVVGVVVRHGSLLSVVGYLLALAAVVGVPVGLLVGLLLGLGLPSRRRRSAPVEAVAVAAVAVEAVAVAATDVVPQQREADWDAALERAEP